MPKTRKEVVTARWGQAKRNAIAQFRRAGRPRPEEIWIRLSRRLSHKGLPPAALEEAINRGTATEYAEQLLSTPETRQDDTLPSADLDLDGDSELGQVDIGTPNLPPLPGAAEPQPEAGGSRMSQDVGPSPKKNPRMESGVEETVMETDTAAQGTLDSDGLAGSGGTSGGGGNSFFRGLAGATHEVDEGMYVDSREFSRGWHVHANLTDVATKAQIVFDKTSYGDPIASFTTASATVNHGCHIVPYWFIDASMKKQDWNRPNWSHLVGWKVKEFGFRFKNMRVEVMNNDRATTEAVAPAPPPDVRFFTFVDKNNDYGFPAAYDVEKMSHGAAFTDEDARDHTDASLPKQPDREFVFYDKTAAELLSTGWKTIDAATRTTYEHIDPNYLYDFKRHPGYTEKLVKDIELEYSFKHDGALIPLPHGTGHNADWSSVNPAFNDYQDNATYGRRQWPVHLETNNRWNTPATQQQKVYQLFWNHHNHGEVDVPDADPLTEEQQNSRNLYSKRPVGPDAGAVAFKDKYIRRTDTSDARFTREGKSTGLNVIGDRAPLFMFGIYPEYEISSTKIQQWRYFMCGQIEYFSKVDFIYRDSWYPLYFPIGKGGHYVDSVTYTAENKAVLPGLITSDPEGLIYTRSYLLRGGANMIDHAATTQLNRQRRPPLR